MGKGKRLARTVARALLIPLLGSGCTLRSSVEPGAGSGGQPGTGMQPGSAGTTSVPGPACTGSTPPAPPAEGVAQGPCDIYAADGGPCVAAHSMIRALYATYAGPLYQVRKSDSTPPQDIMPLAPGGLANAAAQDTYCGTDACTISIIYDQSGKGNHLTAAPPGEQRPSVANEASAKGVPITLGGQKFYGVHIVPGTGYRNSTPCGTATGDDAETEYMIVDGSFSNGGCCFDYGNMETNSRDNGEGTMEAVYFGTCITWGKGADNGPWVMGDLENGLWAGNSSPFLENKPITSRYVMGMVKGGAAGTNHWTIKEGDATDVNNWTTPFSGERPSSRYNPMRKEGAIGLGTGGDASNAARGNWFEGVMTAAYASDMADQAVHTNVVSIYGQP